jgi:hypothetical protein
MPNAKPDAEVALNNLTQRLRQGIAGQLPVSERGLQAVRGVIRHQWEKDQDVEPCRAARRNRVKHKHRESPDRESH